MNVLEGATPVSTLSRAPLLPLAALGRAGLERVLGINTARRLYEVSRLRQEPLFCDRALGALGVSYVVTGDASSIPPSGPLVIVSNHPRGAIDGLVVTSLVSRTRADVRCLANRALDSLSEARSEMFLVDTTGGPLAAARNHRPLRAALSWVRRGGSLCAFPSGVVSHVAAGRWDVRDGPWHASIGRLVRATDATVVPCFIEGANSAWFQLAGLVHPTLRTLLLVRELLRQRGSTIVVHVGAPVDARSLPADVEAATRFLRERSDALRPRAVLSGGGAAGGLRAVAPRTGVSTATVATPQEVPRSEVSRLARRQELARANGYTVFWATASQAPALIQEIGRAREETFRAVGEGTGMAVDLDAFDREYVHLCVWDDKAGALVGAYRMHVLDAARRRSTPLYTRTLFRFGTKLEEALTPALELGRAFVRAPYQKQYAPLALLWTGIGRYVAQHAGARYLFGAVSISSGYSEVARDLMLAFLERHAFDAALARLVEPRQPVPVRADAVVNAVKVGRPQDMTQLTAAVTAADEEGKGVPVLLRQYLKLGARALGFSVDPAFGNTIDVLMVVDLARVPESLLKRYMGAEQAREYLARVAS